jgi:D-beta-D-heptose 7-phosphate kinase/D-beta-D-heptose 1-phosphate adenosyltransferase
MAWRIIMNDVLDTIVGKKILVAGDIMLDRYWWGSVGRISPEAPVPIVELERTSIVAGGAANVAANIAGIGATPILFGSCGEDAEADLVTFVLSEVGVSADHLTRVQGRKTTIKTRIVAHQQHVVRLDHETTTPISTEVADRCLEKMRPVIKSCEAVVVSDYAKGFLTERLLSGLISLASDAGIPIIVDPKGRDFAKYAGASIVTPNKREAAEAAGIDDNAANSVQRSGEILMQRLAPGALLITEGEQGMTLFEGGEVTHLDSVAREVFDVTGAGDTVIAALSAGLAAGLSYFESACLANEAAGIVVGHVGTTSITRELLTTTIDKCRSGSHHA